jgi:hypothetical protein
MTTLSRCECGDDLFGSTYFLETLIMKVNKVFVVFNTVLKLVDLLFLFGF